MIAAQPRAEMLHETPQEFPFESWLSRASSIAGDARLGLKLARDLGEVIPLPGRGQTRLRFDVLTAIGAADLTAARIVEAHLDALAILAEAGLTEDGDRGKTWGVFAAEGPGVRLDASREPSGGFVLRGTKPWCSIASLLDAALVTAHTDGGHRRLFRVSLDSSGVVPRSGGWAARGLAAVPSGPVDFESVAAVPVGDDDWYLRRPGFAWGGIGVAACWLGGAIGLARRVWKGATDGTREPDQLALMHLGAIDASLFSGRLAIREAAALIDSGAQTREEATVLASRVRNLIAEIVEKVASRAAHALGPGPLANEEDHARRVADLELYVRQHHAERDEAGLGSALLASRRSERSPDEPW